MSEFIYGIKKTFTKEEVHKLIYNAVKEAIKIKVSEFLDDLDQALGNINRDELVADLWKSREKWEAKLSQVS